MPFSSVVTVALSILMGMETVDLKLILGVAIGLIAIFISAAGDIVSAEKKKEA